MPDTALTTVEDEQRLLERQRLKTERRELRKREAISELEEKVSQARTVAAKHVALKRYVFLDDEELLGKGLTRQQIAIVRQWEVPKKSTAFAIESSARLVEAEIKAKQDKPSFKINVENAVISLPEKADETIEPVVIQVIPDDKR